MKQLQAFFERRKKISCKMAGGSWIIFFCLFWTQKTGGMTPAQHDFTVFIHKIGKTDRKCV